MCHIGESRGCPRGTVVVSHCVTPVLSDGAVLPAWTGVFFFFFKGNRDEERAFIGHSVWRKLSSAPKDMYAGRKRSIFADVLQEEQINLKKDPYHEVEALMNNIFTSISIFSPGN